MLEMLIFSSSADYEAELENFHQSAFDPVLRKEALSITSSFLTQKYCKICRGGLSGFRGDLTLRRSRLRVHARGTNSKMSETVMESH